MRATQALGRYGEDVAARYLEDRGYELLDRNWRSPRRDLPGELDIIGTDAGGIVFFEVKTRRTVVAGHPAEAVTVDKVQRLKKLAHLWLRLHDRHASAIRIDVIAVMRPINGPARVEHIRNITA